MLSTGGGVAWSADLRPMREQKQNVKLVNSVDVTVLGQWTAALL